MFIGLGPETCLNLEGDWFRGTRQSKGQEVAGDFIFHLSTGSQQKHAKISDERTKKGIA